MHQNHLESLLQQITPLHLRILSDSVGALNIFAEYIVSVFEKNTLVEQSGLCGVPG